MPHDLSELVNATTVRGLKRDATTVVTAGGKRNMARGPQWPAPTSLAELSSTPAP